MIRSALISDTKAIAEIYNYYIQHTHSTFETEAVTSTDMIERIRRIQDQLQLPWLVIEAENRVVGYAYATQWKPRAAYTKTVETTVYIDKDHQGNGYGKLLYQALIEKLRDQQYHALLGGISLPNEGSIALHERMGFTKVGQLKQVGFKFDQWIDVGYWERLL